MQLLPTSSAVSRTTRPVCLSASARPHRPSAKAPVSANAQLNTPILARLQSAGAAVALSAALVLGGAPMALADLNKYEAAAGGEFGNGTALQYGEVMSNAWEEPCIGCSHRPSLTTVSHLQASIAGKDFHDQVSVRMQL